ncbi:thiol-disulfide oxidoreductase [Paenibacillus darwinianus]|uniref:Thiol-disulfide oxidoreductase n=1 Tax=Paenibacillus darwinianus TaxID=1380763 RepID=A0A9W5RZH6_9BACL|nr:redoxin domain-containing protein [Paenibacillus darwinianus]EXX84788.1 thiol-disulfide oxidoreductase [Paenibacillus darwinianus]EXX84862.1 thiol-disulfide oxidoreductase [Paenibacillus darwinianus]EXX85090.1 thiol-disulfide oxidoreductase [Paenibacillus darwinianus]
MTGSKRKIVQIAILIGVLLLGGYAIGKTLFSSDGTPQVGGKPPEFELAAMDGSVQKLSDYKGRPLVINFWGTFCPPCVKEMPEFQRQYVKWKGEGLEILAINLSEDDITVTNFLKRFNLDYQILRDRDRQTEKAYGVRQYPTTFFVKPNGEIKEIFIGGMTEAAIDERITELFRN